MFTPGTPGLAAAGVLIVRETPTGYLPESLMGEVNRGLRRALGL
jgi:hypothetical protein